MIKRFLKTAIYSIVGLMVALILGLFLLHTSSSAINIHNFLKAHFLQFALWRYLLLFLVIYFWPQIVKGVGRFRKWHPRVIVKLIRFRWKLVGFFILFELLFVYNLFGKTIGFIVSFL